MSQNPRLGGNLSKRIAIITLTSIPDGISNNLSIDFGREAKEIK